MTTFVSQNVASGANVENKLKEGTEKAKAEEGLQGSRSTSAFHPLSSALGWTGCQSRVCQCGSNSYYL